MALNIDGQTIHSAFNIKKTIHIHVPLGKKIIMDLRLRHKHLQLLIIDEIIEFVKVFFFSGSLNQIMRNGEPTSKFGNICVMAIGNLYQLPPAFGNILYKQNPGQIVTNWQQFHLLETYYASKE